MSHTVTKRLNFFFAHWKTSPSLSKISMGPITTPSVPLITFEGARNNGRELGGSHKRVKETISPSCIAYPPHAIWRMLNSQQLEICKHTVIERLTNSPTTKWMLTTFMDAAAFLSVIRMIIGKWSCMFSEPIPRANRDIFERTSVYDIEKPENHKQIKKLR